MKISWSKVALVVLCMLCAWFLTVNVTDVVMGIDRPLIKRFNELKLGCSREHALAWMRDPPVCLTNEFALGQYAGNEREYERASNSTARLFIMWNTGVDLSYVLGFDSNDVLVVKCSGGT